MKKGFTLVEIMIVVAIIALIAAIAVPNIERAKKMDECLEKGYKEEYCKESLATQEAEKEIATNYVTKWAPDLDKVTDKTIEIDGTKYICIAQE